MISIRNITIFVVLSALLLSACTEKKKKENHIDIEAALKDFRLDSLSNYASQIRYVALETNDSCLITNSVNSVFLEDNKIFVLDSEPFLKVFDATSGKYLYNIGSKGNGPGQLPHCGSVDLDAKNKRVLLCWSKFIHQFDFSGNFLGRINKPEIADDEYLYHNIVSLDNNLFASGVINRAGDQKTAIAVFDKDSLINRIKSYRNPIRWGSVWAPFMLSGCFFRTGASIRHFRPICDTIYTYDSTLKNFTPTYTLSYGKHEQSFNYAPKSENKNFIKVSIITENEKALFIYFVTAKASPEPFEAVITHFGEERKVIVNAIFGIFDKEKQQLYYLLQPIKGMIGLQNDLDHAIPFIPMHISSDYTLIDYHSAERFIEKAEKIPDLGERAREVLQNLSVDDNLVVIIAK